MNSRERILAALDHREPDRVPIDLGTSDTTMAAEVARGVARLLGVAAPQAEAAPHPAAHITPDESILEASGADVRLVPVPAKPRPDAENRAANPVAEERMPDGSVRWTHPDGRVYLRPAGTWDAQLLSPAVRGDLDEGEIDRLFPAGARPSDWADAAATRTAIRHWQERGRAVQCNCIVMPLTGTSTGPLSLEQWLTELASQPELLCRLMDRYAVKRHIDALAPGGGYVFAPSHMIPRGTPPENVVAMYRTALGCGSRRARGGNTESR